MRIVPAHAALSSQNKRRKNTRSATRDKERDESKRTLVEWNRGESSRDVNYWKRRSEILLRHVLQPRACVSFLEREIHVGGDVCALKKWILYFTRENLVSLSDCETHIRFIKIIAKFNLSAWHTKRQLRNLTPTPTPHSLLRLQILFLSYLAYKNTLIICPATAKTF